MKITKREIIVSIAIIFVMFTIGIFISSKINNSHLDKVQEYNTAIAIDNTELFEYGMRTSVGNAFVYGNLYVVDPVSYDEIDGEYWYVEKNIEKYTQHTRTVTETHVVNGKTQTRTRTETYWTWDNVGTERKSCTNVMFLEVKFDQSQFIRPRSHYIKTVDAGYHKRYVFEGVPTEFKGTIYTKLSNGDISKSNKIYINQDINETKEGLISFNWCYVFWIFWVIFISGIVVGFYYIDNRWLE